MNLSFKCEIIILLSLYLSACGSLPGMQNPDTNAMQHISTSSIQIGKPTLIPINANLILNNLPTYTYRIAPADILNIVVWHHPEFSPKEISANQIASQPSAQGAAGREGYLVMKNGTIFFPLVGTIKVADKTIDEVRKDLTQHLKKYLKNPALNVRIVDFRGKKIYVFGETLKPSFLPLTDQPLSITDAISLTGGLDPNAADPAHIYVIRGPIVKPKVYWLNARTPEKLLLAEQFMLQPNDILYVSSAPAARWNRILNQLLPTIQTIWYTKAIVNNN